MHGNASLRKTTLNARSMLQALGRQDVNVYAGAEKPFCREAVAAPDIHGKWSLHLTLLLVMEGEDGEGGAREVLEKNS